MYKELFLIILIGFLCLFLFKIWLDINVLDFCSVYVRNDSFFTCYEGSVPRTFNCDFENALVGKNACWWLD